jgi:beta-glucosidase
VGHAVQAGVPMRGYFIWSLLDDFEWSGGYQGRLGLHYVDYSTQQRIPKHSAHWYRKVIRTNGAHLTELVQS